ncbi:hypothetical protein [Roseiconus lacunae]|uniref:Secreted protein n=1 Tax=Roseiconus lacunae TaxID=2605694 RepID=A0ABT7PRT4_9BACT|nr:hypothetical protein [Roseiconus lacunae]MCD0457972.1 hypothetical protein [Roseiconus lacunae]MDM4019202.1 hypothetical protein [Roseiconus lacunae]
MRRIFALLFLIVPALLIGCGSGESEAVVDSGDADAIAEYEQMIADEEKAASKAMEGAQ